MQSQRTYQKERPPSSREDRWLDDNEIAEGFIARIRAHQEAARSTRSESMCLEVPTDLFCLFKRAAKKHNLPMKTLLVDLLDSILPSLLKVGTGPRSGNDPGLFAAQLLAKCARAKRSDPNLGYHYFKIRMPLRILESLKEAAKLHRTKTVRIVIVVLEWGMPLANSLESLSSEDVRG
jgi:hypothetical protein